MYKIKPDGETCTVTIVSDPTIDKIFIRNKSTDGYTITDIGDSAFYSCSKLTSIDFYGTKEEWNAITK